MLTGLSYQNAGEFLSRREKIKNLDNGAISNKSASTADTPQIQNTLTKQRVSNE